MAAVSAVIVAAAVALVLSTNHGWWVSDNRFVLYWNPGRALSETFSTWISGRDLGGARQGYSPATYAYVWFVRLLGASPWLAQRIFHATLIAGGGIGMALVCRAFRPRSWLAPLLAGLWFVASPFTVGYLLPSWLFLNAALAPWLLLAVYRGVTTPSRWRWAAATAILVFLAGSLNVPALLFAALPVLPLVLYLWLTRQAALRSVFAFAIRAGSLTLLVFLPSMAQLVAGSQSLGRTVALTESAATVSQSSSWLESFRGLGGWLLYFTWAGRATLGYARVFFVNPLMIIVTFLPLAAAFWAVGWTKWRPRVLFGLILLVSAAAMVGTFPYFSPPPLGWLLLQSYEQLPSTFVLRSGYKAGAGVVIAVGVLLGVAAEEALKRLAGRPVGRWIVGLAVVAVLLATSSPFWTGALYGPSSVRMASIPSYWYEATEWLDAQPSAARAFVLPSARAPAYTWGTPARGDIFPSLLERSFLLDDTFPLGPPAASNLVAALSRQLSFGQFTPGSLRPVASRLGVGYLVIRNDLDPARSGSVPASQLDAVRNDPDVERVATFGAPGENIPSSADSATIARTPVEIYRVRGVDDPVRVAPPGGSLVVSGDGEAWLELAGDGVFSSGSPLQYSGQLDDKTLAEALRSGSSVWITDTNRRRLPALDTLSGGAIPATVDGADLFADPATQSVATYGDGSRIAEVNASGLTDPLLAQRPAATTDGNPTTAWLTGSGLPFQRQGLRFTFVEPEQLSEVRIVDGTGVGAGRRVTGAELVLAGGARSSFVFDGGVGVAQAPPGLTSSFSVIITGVEGSGVGAFGFAEVSADGLDLRETIQLPTDVADSAQRDPEIAALLEQAELSYSLFRLRADPLDPEPSLRRRFLVPSTRVFASSGTFRATDVTSDAELARLVSAPVTAAATDRAGGQLSGSGLFAADGELATGWAPPADGSGRLDLTFARQTVRELSVILEGDAGAVKSVEVALPDGTVSSAADLRGECIINAAVCVAEVRVPVGAATDQLSVSVVSGDPSGPAPRVLEVQVNGTPNSALAVMLNEGCRPGILQLDGTSLPVSASGEVAALLAGEAVSLKVCNPLELGAGWHDQSSEGSLTLDSLDLVSAGRSPSSSGEASIATVNSRSSTRLDITVDAAGGGGWLISGAAATPAWRATVGNEGPQSPTTLDVQAAFRVGEGATTVDVRYAPQRFFVVLVALSSVTLFVCFILLLVDPRPRGRRIRLPTPGPLSPVAAYACRLLFIALCVGVSGGAGLLLGLTATFLLWRRLVTPRTLVAAALGALGLAVIAYFPPFGPALEPFGVTWVSNRGLANSAGRVCALLLAGALFELLIGQMTHAADGRQSPQREGNERSDEAAAAASRDGKSSSTTSDHDRR